MKRGIVISLKKLILRTITFFLVIVLIFSLYLLPLKKSDLLDKLAYLSLSIASGNAFFPISKPNDSAPNDDSEKSKTETKSDNEAKEPVTTAEEIPKEKRKTVVTETLNGTKSDLHYENIYVRNITKTETVDIKKELSKEMDIHIKDDDTVQVLIMHTHTTESYMPADIGCYSTDWPTRSKNEKENMVAVGKVIADKLNEAGIKTVHATDVHDSPQYTGAYDRSGETVQKYLKKYPNIQVVLDIHRDAITNTDKSKVKPTVEIKGKKAAQIMIINGCQDGNIDNYPDWKINMRFALKLQQQIEKDNKGLARPLYFTCKEYNQRLTHGSLLIEMGSEANILDEAKYSAELLSDSLITLLKSTVRDEKSEKSEEE